ncbi:MAG: IPT/TIG domain-containing protein [Planctomycetes bacterium]|nr:IPT/TIG domain-containing protein [Planctomycetota bacterium]
MTNRGPLRLGVLFLLGCGDDPGNVPHIASIGATVTIRGTDFRVGTTKNTVKFGSTAVTVTMADSAQIVCRIPSGLAAGGRQDAAGVVEYGDEKLHPLHVLRRPPVARRLQRLGKAGHRRLPQVRRGARVGPLRRGARDGRGRGGARGHHQDRGGAHAARGTGRPHEGHGDQRQELLRPTRRERRGQRVLGLWGRTVGQVRPQVRPHADRLDAPGRVGLEGRQVPGQVRPDAEVVSYPPSGPRVTPMKLDARRSLHNACPSVRPSRTSR